MFSFSSERILFLEYCTEYCTVAFSSSLLSYLIVAVVSKKWLDLYWLADTLINTLSVSYKKVSLRYSVYFHDFELPFLSWLLSSIYSRFYFIFLVQPGTVSYRRKGTMMIWNPWPTSEAETKKLYLKWKWKVGWQGMAVSCQMNKSNQIPK